MNLGETIYRLRTEKNMSQGDLADALNVSRQSQTQALLSIGTVRLVRSKRKYMEKTDL